MSSNKPNKEFKKKRFKMGINTNREENKKCYHFIKNMKQYHKMILKLLWQVGLFEFDVHQRIMCHVTP